MSFQKCSMGHHPALPEPRVLRGFCPRRLEKVAGEAPLPGRREEVHYMQIPGREAGVRVSSFEKGKIQERWELHTFRLPAGLGSEEGCLRSFQEIISPPPSRSEVVNPALSVPSHASRVQAELPDKANKDIYTKKHVISLRPISDLAAVCAGDAGLFLSSSQWLQRPTSGPTARSQCLQGTHARSRVCAWVRPHVCARVYVCAHLGQDRM